MFDVSDCYSNPVNVQHVANQVNEGNRFAWCSVGVTVKVGGTQGYAEIEYGSYDSLDEFLSCNHCEDLIKNAYEDLKDTKKKYCFLFEEM